jgi:hypothetical protein
MTDAIGHAQITPIRGSEKWNDVSILVSAGLLAVALVIILGAGAFSGGAGPINPDLVIAYP